MGFDNSIPYASKKLAFEKNLDFEILIKSFILYSNIEPGDQYCRWL